jgi:small subunit ribosomal protein S20
MANIKQSKKRAIQSEKRRRHNMGLRSRARTAMKKVYLAITSGNPEEAQLLFRQATKIVDQVADKNIFHKNKAARHKSRLAKAIKHLEQKKSAA